MAQKATVSRALGIAFDGTNYSLTVEVFVTTNSSGDYDTLSFAATSTSFNPVLPNWRTRISNVIKDWSDTYEKDVDQIMFADFGVIGI